MIQMYNSISFSYTFVSKAVCADVYSN